MQVQVQAKSTKYFYKSQVLDLFFINQVEETNSIRIRLAMLKVVTIETDHTSKPWIWRLGINHTPLKITYDIDQAFPVTDLN